MKSHELPDPEKSAIDESAVDKLIKNSMERESLSRRLGASFFRHIEKLNENPENWNPSSLLFDRSASTIDTDYMPVAEHTTVASSVFVSAEHNGLEGTGEWLKHAAAVELAIDLWPAPVSTNSEEWVNGDPESSVRIKIVPEERTAGQLIDYFSAYDNDGTRLSAEETGTVIQLLDGITEAQ